MKLPLLDIIMTGQSDRTFNPTGLISNQPGIVIISINGISDVATGVALDSTGNIIVVGTTATGINNDIAVIRLLPTGLLDPTFAAGSGQPGVLTIAVAAPATTQNGSVNGVIQSGVPADASSTGVAIGTNDAIFVTGTVGSNTLTQYFLTKILPVGSIDTSFGSNLNQPGVIVASVNGIDDEINAIRIDPSGNILLAGFTTVTSTSTNTVNDFLFVRYSQTGLPIQLVTTDILSSDTSVNAITFDTNNKIIVTGSIDAAVNLATVSTSSANLAFVTARYNEDLTLDTTFNPTGAAGSISSQPGTVITNVIPPPNQFFFSNDNYGTGVAVDANNNIYASGVSNGSTQTNFTTVSYEPNGTLNTLHF